MGVHGHHEVRFHEIVPTLRQRTVGKTMADAVHSDVVRVRNHGLVRPVLVVVDSVFLQKRRDRRERNRRHGRQLQDQLFQHVSMRVRRNVQQSFWRVRLHRTFRFDLFFILHDPVRFAHSHDEFRDILSTGIHNECHRTAG